MAEPRQARSEGLADAHRDAEGCRRCDLWRDAAQVVFGEGRAGARLMLVGEQPGDAEDHAGRPFVGPAGALLRAVLAEVGIDERHAYLTNAVKHFKWTPRGKRRIHDKPSRMEIRACHHWLELELSLVAPELVVCLGATAAEALLGPGARVSELRGRVLEAPGVEAPVAVTLHPSAVLRAGDRRHLLRAQLASDLARARASLDAGAGVSRRRIPDTHASQSTEERQMSSMTEPRELFLHELQDVYYAEQAIVKKLPTMIREASDAELSAGLRKHLEQTKGQVKNLEQVFSELGERAKGEKCPGIEGIAAEHDEFMQKEQPSREIRDAFLTGAAARVEHYEIAAYNGLITMARGLGERSAAQLLTENLRQEKDALKLVESIGKRMAKEQSRS